MDNKPTLEFQRLSFDGIAILDRYDIETIEYRGFKPVAYTQDRGVHVAWARTELIHPLYLLEVMPSELRRNLALVAVQDGKAALIWNSYVPDDYAVGTTLLDTHAPGASPKQLYIAVSIPSSRFLINVIGLSSRSELITRGGKLPPGDYNRHDRPTREAMTRLMGKILKGSEPFEELM